MEKAKGRISPNPTTYFILLYCPVCGFRSKVPVHWYVELTHVPITGLLQCNCGFQMRIVDARKKGAESKIEEGHLEIR